MQYSLDSSDGIDGTWTDASNGDTAVPLASFVGKVYIREKSNVTNNRVVAESPSAPVFTLFSDRISGLLPNTSGYYEARISENGVSWYPWSFVSTDTNGEMGWGSPPGSTTQVRVKATSTTLTSYTGQQTFSNN